MWHEGVTVHVVVLGLLLGNWDAGRHGFEILNPLRAKLCDGSALHLYPACLLKGIILLLISEKSDETSTLHS